MKLFASKKLILFGIVVTAAILRLYGLGTNPPALNWDEAALGYNSYSLGADGKDEFGEFLPFKYLESYGDYKPPVYSYLGVFSVKIFGLNEFGVRFPSAMLGALTVLLSYLLVKELFRKIPDERREWIGLSAALFLAISPWHIMLSRGAYEANVSTFFIVLGVFSFLRAVNRNSWYLILSAISFAVSFYTFNTARVFVPLLAVFLVVIFRKYLLSNKKQAILAGLVGLIMVGPLIPFLLSPQAKLRFQEVNIFSDSEIVKVSNQKITNDNNAFWSKIINNRRIGYGLEFGKHYLDNLNPNFLFITGDGNPRFSTQDVGQLYLWDLPFLIFGTFLLVRKREGHWWLIPVWVLLGIIPAATARETPHALRIETIVPTLQIITAYGFIEVISMLKKRKKSISFALILALALSVFFFWHGYVKHYAREYSSEWQYPYKEAVAYVGQVKNNYKSIEITDGLGRPYIYFLLYDKYDPRDFRKSAKIDREVFGFVHVRSFDKYKFRKGTERGNLEKDTLYLDVPDNVPKESKVLRVFYQLDGKPALVAYETK